VLTNKTPSAKLPTVKCVFWRTKIAQAGSFHSVRLEIMYSPVAAPDLNPQEHVWKAVRRAVSHNHVTPRLPELADRFEQHPRE